MSTSYEEEEHYVIKRDGNKEKVSFDKILNRIKKLGQPKQLNVNYTGLVMKIIDQIYNNIETEKIDEVMAEQCASMCSNHYDYYNLASYLVISNNQKKTGLKLFEYISLIYVQENQNYISDTFYNLIKDHHEDYEDMIDHSRDYLIDYFGFKTLERAYLMRYRNKIVESIQYMWMRVAIQIHGDDLEKVKETYDCLSQKDFIHATPTLFNAGTKRPQLSSCFLLGMEEDSIKGIFNTLSDCASISKWAGGIGLHIHNIRAEGTKIQGTNGMSNGLTPMLRVFNNTARYCDQGGGKRKGSFAMYLETWHGDIEAFLELKKNHGDEESRARDLFYALWISDYYMECVEKNVDWYLMSSDQCPGLHDKYGEEFKALYTNYVEQGKYIKKIKARDLWFKILESQMETGTPYMLYKDAANSKSNQKNLGTIKSSNLCAEIIEYSDSNESAVCNLASISLPSCIKYNENGSPYFCYDKLLRISKILTNNLNKIIDHNFYPTEKTQRSNFNHRPIGIGVQGLADVFALMEVGFDSDEAKQLNKLIFETIYYGSMLQSNEIAKVDGSYSTFEGSPLSEGKFQFDLWNVQPSSRYNWDLLRSDIIKHGVRNSLCVALMPTASTSQILGNNECFEPFTSNIYMRRTLAGEFMLTNKHLIKKLCKLNLWNGKLKNEIIRNKGSIQNIDEIPDKIKSIFKIVWEIEPRVLIDMAKDRGAYVCQSQSMNLWIEDPNYKNLTKTHFYAWKQGLKTGIYYLRRKAKHQAQQFTVEPVKEPENPEKNLTSFGSSESIHTVNEDEGCVMCSG